MGDVAAATSIRSGAEGLKPPGAFSFNGQGSRTRVWASPLPRSLSASGDVGILRQRGEFTPRRQIWFRSAQPWVTDIDEVQKNEKQG